MQIHLSEISSAEGRIVHMSVKPEFLVIDFGQGNFPVLESPPVELTIENTGSRVLELSGTGSITAGIPCSRCLTETAVKIPLEFRYRLDMRLNEEQRIEALDENSFLTGTDLDVDRLVCLEVLMNWPGKVLCKEDCKGICSQCGKNLNEGSCGCNDEPKDPRMAAISDIFRKFKEV